MGHVVWDCPEQCRAGEKKGDQSTVSEAGPGRGVVPESSRVWLRLTGGEVKKWDLGAGMLLVAEH